MCKKLHALFDKIKWFTGIEISMLFMVERKRQKPKGYKKEKLQKYLVIYKKSIDKLKHLCYSNIRKKVKPMVY